MVKKKVAVKEKKQKNSFSNKIDVESKKIDRKSGLEIVKEKKKEEEEEWSEDSDWQIPTFIRRNKEK